MNEKSREDIVGGNVTTPPPARAHRVRRALLVPAGAGIVAYLDLCVRRRAPIEAPELPRDGESMGPPIETVSARHWEDTVDMNAAPPPLRRNPSSWSHRLRVASIAAVGAILATYMGLYQLHLIPSVCDPVFGKGTERMLTSEVTRVMDRVFHLPDALLGALGYSSEIIFSLSGSTRRWQYRPWLVLLLGLTVLGLGLVSAALSEEG